MRRGNNQYTSAICIVITLVVLMLQSASSSHLYTWDKAYPQSCECMESGASGKDCTLFRCKCTSDLTAGECDYGSCCDPDCSESQVDRFKSRGECKSEGFAPDEETLCYTDEQLAKINPKEPLYGAPTARKSLDQALCVSKKNFYPKVNYYTDTGLQSKSIFSKKSGQKQYDYSSPVSYSISADDSDYDLGDIIASYSVIDSTTYEYLNSSTTSVNKKYIPFSENVWRLPTNDYTGECNAFGNVQFEKPFSTKSCRKVVEYNQFDNYCSNELSIQYLVNSLVLAGSADVSSSVFGIPSALNTQGVTLRSLKYVNSANNMVVDWYEDKFNGSGVNGSCLTQVFKGKQNEDGEGIGGPDLKKCTPFVADLVAWNSTIANQGLTACISAVKEIVYTVEHDASAKGTITSIYADVVLIDILPVNAVADISLTNSYSVDFVSSSSSSASFTNGNIITRPRSGNPGYLHGKPVVLGQWNGSHVKIEYDEAGIQLPVSSRATPSSFPSTLCARSDTYQNVEWETDTLTYGADMSTSCSIPLNWVTLRDMCCEGTTSCNPVSNSPYNTQGLPLHFVDLSLRSFSSSTTPLEFSGMIGQYGNSDPLDTSQWIEMSLSTALSNLKTSKVWDDSRGVCSGMPSGLHFKFLVVKTGEKYNPQIKIVAADIEVTTSDWKIRVPVNDRETTQNFQLATTVSFVQKNDQSYKGYVPPNPPALFSVPADIFYPFAANAAPSKSMVSFAAFAIASLLSTLAILLVSSI